MNNLQFKLRTYKGKVNVFVNVNCYVTAFKNSINYPK